jgi:hypothetical protein
LLDDFLRWTRKRWLPFVLAFFIAHIVLLGPFLVTDGVPRGGDMAVNMVNGSVAQNGTWHQLWDDTRYPGQAKHVSRFGLGDLALSKLAWLTGDITLAIRLMVWGFHVIAMLGMYLYVSRITGSRWAGALAGLAFVLSAGAPMRAIMAMIAGFALLPLLFYAVERLMDKPNLKNGLLLSITLALYGVTSIPPFTYIVAMALVVYVSFFLASRSLLAVTGRARPQTLAQVIGYGALAAFVAVPLATYFITGLTISTAQLLSETGGYDIDSLQSGKPTLAEAITFRRGSTGMNTPLMAAAGWGFAALALTAPALARSWRALALVTIAFGAVLFASDVPNPLYQYMYDHLPYFSSVRGTRRWTSLTLFGFSGAGAITLAYLVAWTRSNWDRASLRGRVSKRVGIVASAAVSLSLIVVFAAQLPAVRDWLAPYPLSEEFTAPYEYLQTEDPGTVYAPTPFLGKRLKDDDFSIGVAHGKKAGPGISGQPAFGVFQSGGKEVNTEIFDLVSSMKTYPANLFPYEVIGAEPVSLADRQNRGPRNVQNFFFAGDITVSEFETVNSAIRVQFHRFKSGDETGFHAVDIYPAAGVFQFKEVVGDREALLDSGTLQSARDGTFYLEVMSYEDELGVWVDGWRVIRAPLTKYSGADVQISASAGQVVRLQNGELNILTGGLDADYSLPGLLGLFRVQYLVVQPNTTEFERRRLMSLPGLTLVEQWEGSSLYLNEYYTPGQALFSEQYGVYQGDGVELTRALYKLDPVARNKLPLISLDDAPLDVRAEMLSNASFIATDLTGYDPTATPPDLVAAKVFAPYAPGYLPPAVFSWNLDASNVLVADEESFETVSLGSGIPLEIGRGRNFVFESSLFPPVDAEDDGDFLLRFRVRPDERFYELRISRSGLVNVELHRPRNVRLLATGRYDAAEYASVRLRVAALDDQIRVWLNGKQVIGLSDATIDKGGPIVAISLADGGYLGPRSLVAGDESLVGIESLAEEGFTNTQISLRSTTLTPALIASLGHARTFTTSLAPVAPGEYRVLVSGTGPAQGAVNLSLSSGGRSIAVPLSVPEFEMEEWITAPGVERWAMVSAPVRVTGSESLLLTTESPDVTLGQLLLAEHTADDIVLSALLAPSTSTGLMFDKESSTQYTGSISNGQPGALIFQDAYHNGWKAVSDGESLPHFSAFGSLNGYWVSGAAEGESDLVVKFAPQSRYMRGIVISTVAFVLVVISLAMLVWWERGLRDTQTGLRIRAKAAIARERAAKRARRLTGWLKPGVRPAGL